jgi:hypothetical protein
MGLPRQIGDEDVERLLSGAGSSVETTDEMRDLASFVAALGASMPAQPHPDVERVLVPRLATVARSVGERAAAESTMVLTPLRGADRGAARRRIVLFARVAVAVALVPAMLAGLAFAGITLPEPAQDAFERLGIELPNQSAVDDGQAGDGETRGSDQATASKDEQSEPGDEDDAAAGTAGTGKHHGGQPTGEPGKAKAKGHGKPQDTGPSGGIAPGQGGTPPGQGGVPAGSGGLPPGTPGVPPSGGGSPPTTPPGQGGVPPGQAN